VAIKEIFTIGKEARKKIILFLGGGDINSCRDAIKNILSYLDIIKLIADGYFYRIVSPCAYIDNLGFEKEVLEKIIEKIDWARAAAGKENLDSIRPDEKKRVVRISSNGCMAFDKNAREVWIPWFRGIPGIVLDLMRNAIYSSCKIKDPRFENDDLRADMWVFVDYNQCGVDIILANGCSCRSREIFSKLKKHRWSTLIEIGGSVEEYLINEKTFGVKVNLPYAAYMKS
jgi:hypothetical protein